MDSRSPIKEAPLRNPGQSLDERRVELVLDRLLLPALAALFLTVLWLQDLWRAYQAIPPMPWLSGVFAAIAIAYAAWKIARTLPELRNIRLALQGERSVGQGLEQLRAQGYAVYHDIVGDGFNVDHVLVGPAGVFTLETKTRSKPLRGRATIVVDGDAISVNGQTPDRDPVPQARAQSAWIADVLRKSTGQDFPVSPVVVFPGWWVEIKAKPSHLWVINDKALPKFLAREKDRLTSERVCMAKFHLEAFIRSQTSAR